MARSSVMSLRVDSETRQAVDAIMENLGITTATAVNMLFRQIILTGGLPFEVKMPQFNDETLAALEEARIICKTGKRYNSFKALVQDLDSEQ